MAKGLATNEFSDLYKRLGYRFEKSELLLRAVTHRSWCNESATEELDNERLEFLGDAVLDLAVSELLFRTMPEVDEGPLTQWRALLVNATKLAELAQGLDLGFYLRLGVGEEKSGGRERTSNLANALEAVIGAIYVDGGFAAAEKVVHDLIAGPLEALAAGPLKDPRSRLQEWAQAKDGTIPQYEVKPVETEEDGPFFVAEVHAGDVLAIGEGRTKKAAIHCAAAMALRDLGVS